MTYTCIKNKIIKVGKAIFFVISKFNETKIIFKKKLKTKQKNDKNPCLEIPEISLIKLSQINSKTKYIIEKL